jgi:hypothetical protein
MARVNVYVPDDLLARWRTVAATMPHKAVPSLSKVIQEALTRKLEEWHAMEVEIARLEGEILIPGAPQRGPAPSPTSERRGSCPSRGVRGRGGWRSPSGPG